MSDGSAYRVEKMGGTPDDIKKLLPPDCWCGPSWCIVRNHDDEPRATYETREDAQAAIDEIEAAQ